MSVELAFNFDKSDEVKKEQELKNYSKIQENLDKFITSKTLFADSGANQILQTFLKDFLNLDNLKVAQSKNEETGEVLFFAKNVQEELDNQDSELNQFLKFILFLRKSKEEKKEAIDSLSKKFFRLKVFYYDLEKELNLKKGSFSEKEKQDIEKAEYNYKKAEMRLEKMQAKPVLQEYADLLKNTGSISQFLKEGKINLAKINLKDAQAELSKIIQIRVIFEQEKKNEEKKSGKHEFEQSFGLVTNRIRTMTLLACLCGLATVAGGYSFFHKRNNLENPSQQGIEKVDPFGKYRELMQKSLKNETVENVEDRFKQIALEAGMSFEEVDSFAERFLTVSKLPAPQINFEKRNEYLGDENYLQSLNYNVEINPNRRDVQMRIYFKKQFLVSTQYGGNAFPTKGILSQKDLNQISFEFYYEEKLPNGKTLCYYGEFGGRKTRLYLE